MHMEHTSEFLAVPYSWLLCIATVIGFSPEYSKNDLLSEEQIWQGICIVSFILYAEGLLRGWYLHGMYLYMMLTSLDSFLVFLLVPWFAGGSRTCLGIHVWASLAQPHAALEDHKPFAKITLNSIVYSLVHHTICFLYCWKGIYKGFLKYNEQSKSDINYLHKKRYTLLILMFPFKSLQRGLECTKQKQKWM